jgi:CRP-like cAMP-binding protein
VAQRLHAQPLSLTTTVAAGTTLIRQGDPYVRAWIVVTGVLIERVVSPEGRVLIPRLPGPGDLVGGAEGPASPLTLVALRRTSLRPATERELLDGSPHATRRRSRLRPRSRGSTRPPRSNDACDGSPSGSGGPRPTVRRSA